MIAPTRFYFFYSFCRNKEMTWTRESLLAAARTSYPNLRECFLEPMVDLYLTKPDVFKDIIKRDMKREAKAKKSIIVPVPNSLYENAVSVATELKYAVVVEVENEETPSEAVAGQSSC